MLPTLARLFHLAYFVAMYFLFPYTPLWIMLVYGFPLLVDDQCEHQRRVAQFHSQPIFPIDSCSIAFSESSNRSPAVFRRPITTSSTCSITKATRIGRTKTAKRSIGSQFTNTATTARPKTRGVTFSLASFATIRRVIKRELAKRGKVELRWGNIELAVFITILLAMAIIVPTGRFISSTGVTCSFSCRFSISATASVILNGYFRHYGANPDKPIAWGVSSYGKIYNWLFFYNGYHAEHHFRPKVHWTKMEKFRQSIEELQKQEDVRVIEHAHMLGFLDPESAKRGNYRSEAPDLNAASV